MSPEDFAELDSWRELAELCGETVPEPNLSGSQEIGLTNEETTLGVDRTLQSGGNVPPAQPLSDNLNTVPVLADAETDQRTDQPKQEGKARESINRGPTQSVQQISTCADSRGRVQPLSDPSRIGEKYNS